MTARIRRRLIAAAVAAAAILTALWGAWMIAPYCVGDPMVELARRTPVRSWLDRRGKVLWHERAYDAEWRFVVPLEKISPHAVRVVLAAEDAGFYRHSGVDCGAVARAAWQNLAAGKRLSGASTITMQLAGMALPPGKHDLRRKFHQAVLARKLELCHTKDEILAEYLNRIPFGGKLHGIEAAARYYFGLPAAKLNLAEATLLCGLPQKPNKLRPDRHLERARERQRIVLKLLVRRGETTAAEAERILHREPLRLRDFRYRAPFMAAAFPGELYHVFTAPGASPRTTIDRELHYKVLAMLRNRRSQLRGVRDGAAVLIDNRTREVLVRIGTLDFRAKPDGEVDAVRAVRSAGSSLKPFIYAEAAAAGFLVSSTRLLDAPVRYGDYAPGNYDGSYRGPVSAAFALSHSLNTPAVRLVSRLGEERVADAFAALGMKRRRSGRNRPPGLSLALGTEGYTLWELTRAYAILASGGRYFEPTLSRDTGRPPDGPAVFSPELCAMILSMLRERPLGYGGPEVAWKTGTSNNNCDAWCFACTPEYTLGVWFGNKNGARSDDLVGADAAVPAAADIFAMLYRNAPPPGWPDETKLLELRELCAESGLTPGAFCTRRSLQTALPGVPLVPCRGCAPGNRPPLRILSPPPRTYLPPPGQSAVMLKLAADGKGVSWYLNGRFLGRNLAEHRFPGGARYTLRAVEEPDDPEAPLRSAEVTFSVQNRHP